MTLIANCYKIMKYKTTSTIFLLNLALAFLSALQPNGQTKILNEVDSSEKCCQRISPKIFTFDLLKDSTESQEETIDTYTVLPKRFCYIHSNLGFLFSSLESTIRSQTEYIGQPSRSPPFLAS